MNIAKSLITALCVLSGVSGCNENDSPTPNILTETISVDRTATNSKLWRVNFDATRNPDHVLITLQVRLVPGPGISVPQLTRLEESWESDVEALWSDHFALDLQSAKLPIRLDLQFSPRNPHHTVVVKTDPSIAVDQLNWSRWSGPNVIAHEVGHMLGAYDEYAGGGQDPDQPRVDRNSIMSGSPEPSTGSAPRHYDVLRSWARDRFGSAEVVPIEVAD